MRVSSVAAALLLLISGPSLAGEWPGRLALDFDPHAELRFDGVVGRRIDANTRGWLVRAPAANPGLLGMFALRDRQPEPNLVPWAGEFAGKYLISAIQALRMADDPELEATVRAAVETLLAAQADDGYLGPFPKDERLLGHWDLWGHYHVMLALIMWHERTGDREPLAACRKAADLVCQTYLDTDRRMLEAGSTEMNLAIIHALGGLHRTTGEERYLRMMREIETDWQEAGDYFRTGLAGVEFHRTPKPRWESLHDLQGLVELYRITGDPRYRTAFLNHWQSIRHWDRHNTGGFSSGERATGSPYQPAAIETCCTIAWMALTVDALRLTGDPLAADELELSTFNGMLGAQHPSGNWWTYNTPMNGVREASDHTIVFQARAGTPELNCCSVNAPRGLGMLSEWALLRSDDGLVINYFGPMRADVKLADGTAVTVQQETQYPLAPNVRIGIRPETPAEFSVKLRIPAWSTASTVQWPGSPPVDAPAGSYFVIRRQWKPGDAIELKLDVRLRSESGDGEQYGRMSVYRGAILLAYDVRHNRFDEAEIPVLTPSMLAAARVSFPPAEPEAERVGRFAPWVFVDVPADEERTLRLCDFATAGATGSRYVSWLPAEELAPPPPVPAGPPELARVPPGPMVFTWRRPLAAAAKGRTHTLVLAETPDFKAPVLELAGNRGSRLVVAEEDAARLKPDVDYYWKLIATNASGATESLPPARRLRVEPSLPKLTPELLSEYGEGPGGVLVAAELRGDPKPSYGSLARAEGFKPAEGPGGEPNGAIELDGQAGMLVYKLRAFPALEYTVAVWVAHQHKEEHLGQVFSAWCQVMDDPLRICIDNGKLFARIEAGKAFSTEGVALEPDRWYHVAVVKAGERLTLYVDGKPAASAQVPVEVHSAARDFALGGNPHYTGQSEHLACRLSQLAMYVRALKPEEVAELYEKQRPR